MIVQFNESLSKIFLDLENTASWFGIKLTSVDQRNDYNDTPLHTICSWGEILPVKVIVEAGADVNASGDKGFSPLFKAVVGDSVEVVSYLLEQGANKSLTNDWGDTPFVYASLVKSDPRILHLLR